MASHINPIAGVAPGKVVVAVVQSDGKFLLIHRKVPKGKLSWSFPGGTMEPGETDLAAAEREVFEETGVQCEAIRTLGQRHHPETGRLLAYVLCKYIGGHAQNVEPDKAYYVEWLQPSTAISCVTSSIFAPVKDLLKDAMRNENGRLATD